MFIKPTIGTITGGQAIIPVGAHSFSINVVSGSAYANGTLLNASTTWNVSFGDSKFLLGEQIALGTTGVGARVTYMYFA